MNKSHVLQFIAIVTVFFFIVGSAQSTRSENTTDPTFLNSIHLSVNRSDPIIVTQDSDFHANGFEGNGTLEDPFLIKDLLIENAFSTLISIFNTSAHFKILDNHLVGSDTTPYGINLVMVQNGIVESNGISQVDNAISIQNSSKVLVTKNSIRESQSSAIQITNSSNLTISQNNLETSIMGIDLETAAEVSIINNHIARNQVSGIIISESSRDNSVAWNNFDSNNVGQNSQAQDDGLNNLFSNNYWDDWSDPDADSDGVVDLPYSVDGLAGSTDVLPATKAHNVNGQSFGGRSNQTSNYIQGTFSIAIIAFLGFIINFLLLKLQQLRLHRLTDNVTTEMIGYSSPVLISLIHSSEDPRIEVEEPFPPELMTYKYILNPIRLAVLKMLYENHKYPSYLMRDTLGISWGSFGSHIDVMVKKGLIVTQEEFVDGSPRQVLQIEQEGTQTYIELQKLFRKFFNQD